MIRFSILFFALIWLTSCAGDVHITYDASNDDVYYTSKDTAATKTVERDTTDHVDYYDPETAQNVYWGSLRDRNAFDPLRYRYYIEDDQDGMGFEQKGCHIHEFYGNDEIYENDDDHSYDDGSDGSDDRDREYDTSGNGRKR